MFGSLPHVKANIITNKFNDLKTFFVDLKIANAEYDKAYKEYLLNQTKNCAQEIDDFKKAAEKVLKTSRFTDPLLYNLLLTDKDQAAEKCQSCITEKCKDTRDKYIHAAEQLGSKYIQICKITLFTLIGTYCTFKFGPMIARKIARIPLEPHIHELINKYALSNTEHTKNALALCMRQQNKKHIPTIPSSIGLWNTPTIKALAEAFYGVELITENPFLFQIFENELHEQRSTFY